MNLHRYSHKYMCCKVGLIRPRNASRPVAGHSRSDDVAAPYCCPTPPVSPKGCRSGPVAQRLGGNHGETITTCGTNIGIQP